MVRQTLDVSPIQLFAAHGPNSMHEQRITVWWQGTERLLLNRVQMPLVWLLDTNARGGNITSEAVRDVAIAVEDLAGSEFQSLL